MKEKYGPRPARGYPLVRLRDLPANFWKESPYDGSGTQFYTKVRIGLSSHNIMLDGGSGANSTTEELVLQIINENREAGISFQDKRHPIKQLEKWKHTEGLRGVAGSKTVPLLGAVAVRLNMIELGKDDGPEILARFKVCEAKSTDWVGWILGARAIDCPGNGGLGFIPLEYSHSFTALGIQMARTERVPGEKPDSCYAIRSSVLDSDSESEIADAAGGRAEPSAGRPRGIDSASGSDGLPLLYEGEPITLSKGEGAWVPVVLSGALDAHEGTELQCVFPSRDSPVEAVSGLWGGSRYARRRLRHWNR